MLHYFGKLNITLNNVTYGSFEMYWFLIFWGLRIIHFVIYIFPPSLIRHNYFMPYLASLIQIFFIKLVCHMYLYFHF